VEGRSRTERNNDRSSPKVVGKIVFWMWQHGGWTQRSARFSLITSSAGAVAKYCDEYVCLSACLSVREDISGTARVIFTKFFVRDAYVRGSVPSGTLTIGRIAYRREGGNGSAQRGRSVVYERVPC